MNIGGIFFDMAANKKSFILYCDLIHTVSKLDDQQAGKLFKHILSYVNDEKPVTEDLITNIAFEPVKQALKRDLVKYEELREKNKENARKRWDSKKNEKIPNDATASDRMRMDTKNADNVNVNVSVINNINNESEIIALYETVLKEIREGKHSILLDQIKIQLKIDSLESLSKQFNTHLLAENILHPNVQKFISHFRNWLNSMNAKGRLEEYKTIRKGAL